MKKALALLLALVFCFILASCNTGSSQTSPEASTAAPSSSTAPDSTEPASPSTDSTAAIPEVLKIGLLANETGWFSAYDANGISETKMLVDIINNNGGLKVGDKTYTLELDIQDGQSDATGIRNAAQILVNDGVKYVLETNDFWVEGALDLFEGAGIMNLQAQNNVDLRALGPDLQYSYTFCNGAAANFDAAMKFIVQNYPDVKSIVYAQNDDGNTDPGIALIKDLCVKYGLTYIDKPVIFDPQATDYTPIALQIMNTGADAFIGNYTPAQAGGILKEIRNNGNMMVEAAIVGLAVDLLLQIAGPEASTRAFTMGPDYTTQANNTEQVWDLFTKFKEIYGDEAAASYNGNFANNLFVLTNLMTACQSIEVKDVIAYWDTLETVDTLFGTGKIGGTQTYGCNHAVALPAPISYLKDGQVLFAGWFETDLP